MKRSTYPTDHIIIRASTTSDWDNVDFAIIGITKSFREVMYQRLSIAEQFRSDDSFHNLNYWVAPLSYYCNSETSLHTEEIIPAGENWTFINLDPMEQQGLATPKIQLEGHQLIISKHGYANFKASSKNTKEEYLTELFSISEVFRCKGSKSIYSP